MLREILINVAEKEKRVALLEDKTLQEFYIEREDSRGIFGNIYKGKVKTIIPGMGAAFVDLGLKKDGFLYVSDIVALPTEYGEISSVPLRQGSGGERGKEDINKLDIFCTSDFIYSHSKHGSRPFCFRHGRIGFIPYPNVLRLR